jgi:hypothetical protein
MLSWNAEPYHAGLSATRRKQVQKAFMSGKSVIFKVGMKYKKRKSIFLCNFYHLIISSPPNETKTIYIVKCQYDSHQLHKILSLTEYFSLLIEFLM